MNRPKSAYTARATSARRPNRPIIDLSRKPEVTCFLVKRHDRAQSEDFRLPTANLPIVFRPIEDPGDDLDSERFKSAYRLRAEGRFEEAVKEFEEVVRGKPGCVAARLNLGVCLMKLGRLTEAARAYKDSGHFHNDPRLTYNLALCLITTFAYDEARGILMRICKSYLSSDVTRLLKYIDSKSTHIPGTEATEISADISGLEEYTDTEQRSFSHIRPKTGKESPSVEEPSWGMWKIFKSIEDYGGSEIKPMRPSIPRKAMRAKSARAKVEHSVPKPSFITVPRHRPPSETSSTPMTVERTSTMDRRNTDEVMSPPLRRVHNLGSVTQEDMEDGSTLKSVHPSHRNEHAVMLKISEARQVIEAEENKLSLKHSLLPEVDAAPIVKDRLTVSALTFIRTEMQKPASDRNYPKLVDLIADLHFFAKFQREVCMDILHSCMHSVVQSNTYVFRQKDPEHCMYIILSGSVVIEKQAPEYGDDTLSLRTFYDGDTFGEINLLSSEAQVRPVSVRTLELTDLFTLRKSDYHRLMMSQMRTDIEAKLRFFSGLQLFSGVQKLALVPLVSNVDVTCYRFGQTIVSAGSVPNRMYLIYSGLCQVYAEGYTMRQRTEGRFAKADRRPKPQFRTGNTQYSNVIRPAPPSEIKEIDPNLVKSRFHSSNFSRLLKDNYIVKEMTRLEVLQPGDFFCSRCVTITESESLEPSKLTIVAESSEVRLYELTKVHMEFLGENVEVRSM